jgi:pantothenate kinase-related protein Tda10
MSAMHAGPPVGRTVARYASSMPPAASSDPGHPLVIAIDGPASSGKSSVGAALASTLG